MQKYIKKFLPLGLCAAILMVGEVSMDLLQPSFMSTIVDEGVLGLSNNGVGSMSVILSNGIKMIALVLFGGLCGGLCNIVVQNATQKTANLIRKDTFAKIMSFSFSQVDKYSTGSLVTRTTNDITQIQQLLGMLVRGLIRNGVQLFGSLYFIFKLNKTYGWIIATSSLVLVCVLSLFIKQIAPLFPVLQKQIDKINSVMQEDVAGIRIIKACVREDHEKNRFGQAHDQLLGTQFKFIKTMAYMSPIVSLIMNGAIAGVILVSPRLIDAGKASPGTIMAVISYVTTLLHGLIFLVLITQFITRGMASWKRVKEILDTEPEIKDGTKKIKNTTGELEFKNVSFAYPDASSNVLNNINLKVNAGETLAIMGATGCGKSSILKLIPRFYDINEGEILLDGVNIKDLKLKDLRSRVSIALQKAELFTQTIEENIKWGDSKAKTKDVLECSKIAQADSFIQQTPDKYKTPVAERGMSLSGGQKQRISLARSIIKDSEILLLDDSTSALDLKTEAAFFKALNKAKPNCTKIIVAQRVATVKNADRIAIVENGTIIACAPHKELLQSCQAYQDIYYSQMGKEANNG